MEIETTPLHGVLLIKPKIWGDERGHFVETWQQERYTQAGIIMPFVQDNHSSSSFGILRGLHFQKTKPQGKLVRVSFGSVFDVAVDIRPDSISYGSWYGVELTQKNQWQLWIPPGFAHGFVVTSERAHFEYKVTDFYDAQDEGTYRWDSPDLGITWPVQEPILSAKDVAAPFFNK